MTGERSLHPTLLIGLLITTCKNFRDRQTAAAASASVKLLRIIIKCKARAGFN